MIRVRAERRLKARDLGALPPGVHEDGGGLRLLVEAGGPRRWVLRVTIAGKRRNRGLGPFPLVSLQEARDKALDFRRAAREGRDLAAERQQRRATGITFREVCDAFLTRKRQSPLSEKHLRDWSTTLEAYALPSLGHVSVEQITHTEIVSVLQPIWFEKPETAKRLLMRLKSVFVSAIAHGRRVRASPCDGVAQELGMRRREANHYRALPFAEVPVFIKKLRECDARPVVKLCLEWAVLTACRSGEARRAAASEIVGERWVISSARMKARAEHIVPLSGRWHALSTRGAPMGRLSRSSAMARQRTPSQARRSERPKPSLRSAEAPRGKRRQT